MSGRRKLLLGVLLGLALCGPARAPEEGEPARNWKLSDPDGIAVDYYDDSRGYVSVVLFWATWCPYCRTLMPHLQVLADEFRERPVRFYALNVWEDGDPVAYLEKYGYSFHLLLDADPVADAWGVPGTPGLFVAGPDHRVIYKRRAGEDDLDVEIAVREAIAGSLAAR